MTSPSNALPAILGHIDADLDNSIERLFALLRIKSISTDSAFKEACRAFKAVTGKLPLDITMMIEGEEECGSNNLFPFVRDNAAEFRRDLALVCDTGMWNAQTPAITTSLRGLVYEEVRITCADRD